MKTKKHLPILGADALKVGAKMTTKEHLKWLEKAREFTLKTTPKSLLRAYLKLREN